MGVETMSQKVKIKITSTITLKLEEGIEVNEFLDDIDFALHTKRTDGKIVDYEIDDYETVTQ